MEKDHEDKPIGHDAVYAFNGAIIDVQKVTNFEKDKIKNIYALARTIDADVIITTDGEVVKSKFFPLGWILTEYELKNTMLSTIRKLFGKLENRRRKLFKN